MSANPNTHVDWVTAQGIDVALRDADGAWPDLAGRTVDRGEALPRLQRIPQGTQQGRSAVAIRIDLPDRTVILETTARAFITAAKAVRAACEMDGEDDLP